MNKIKHISLLLLFIVCLADAKAQSVVFDTNDSISNIVMPNVFTPNGDNVNETLKFKNLEFFSTNNLTILNRWGTKVFEKDSYKNDWNGSGVVDGTYFYILSVPGATPNIYKGFFQMIR